MDAEDCRESVMSEFLNRMDTQREVLRVVNGLRTATEPLFGLSSHAIERWARNNQISEESRFYKLIRESAAALFVLATKSQEQVTEEYKENSLRVSALIRELANSIER